MQADDAVVVLLQDGNWGLSLCASEIVANIEIEADVLAEFENGVRFVQQRKVVGVIVETDPDFVLIGEGRESFGESFVAFGGDAGASERFGDLKIEVNVLVGLAERNFVEVNVNTRVVVKLAQRPAFGQLRLAFGVG